MIPIIKMTVEHMRQDILHAFDLQQDEWRDGLTRGLNEAIRTFDYESEVRNLATRQLQDMCTELIKETVRSVMYDQDFRVDLKKRLVEKLQSPDDRT